MFFFYLKTIYRNVYYLIISNKMFNFFIGTIFSFYFYFKINIYLNVFEYHAESIDPMFADKHIRHLVVVQDFDTCTQYSCNLGDYMPWLEDGSSLGYCRGLQSSR